MCSVDCDNMEIKIPTSSGDSECLTEALVFRVYVLEAEVTPEGRPSHADAGQQNALAGVL